MNYDDQVLGVGNSFHPANQQEIETDHFESNNLQKCLDYAKDFKDFEPIENAIIDQNVAIEKAISELNFLIDSCIQNKFMQNRLIALKRQLMFNQK